MDVLREELSRKRASLNSDSSRSKSRSRNVPNSDNELKRARVVLNGDKREQEAEAAVSMHGGGGVDADCSTQHGRTDNVCSVDAVSVSVNGDGDVEVGGTGTGPSECDSKNDKKCSGGGSKSSALSAITAQLRALGVPVRFFAETDEQQSKRLRTMQIEAHHKQHQDTGGAANQYQSIKKVCIHFICTQDNTQNTHIQNTHIHLIYTAHTCTYTFYTQHTLATFDLTLLRI